MGLYRLTIMAAPPVQPAATEIMTLRIAIIADIHHGAPTPTKWSDAAMSLMVTFAAFVRDTKPDLVLDLGDRISDVNHDVDLALEQEVAKVFEVLEAPVYHICGNHDRDHLSVVENEAILGQSLQNQRLDRKD